MKNRVIVNYNLKMRYLMDLYMPDGQIVLDVDLINDMCIEFVDLYMEISSSEIRKCLPN